MIPAGPKREVPKASRSALYSTVARMPRLDPFVRMSLNPFDATTLVRFPDGVMRMTGLSRLVTRDIRTVQPTDQANGMATCLPWRPSIARTGVLAADETFPVVSPSAAPTRGVLAGSFGQIAPWADLSAAGSTTGSWTSGFTGKAISLAGSYPGYAAYYDVADMDRTVACAIRLECSGLPTGQFAYSGRVYGLYVTSEDFFPLNAGVVTPPFPKGAGVFQPSFDQVTNDSILHSAVDEAYCMDAVAAGTGVSMTLADVARSPVGFNLPWFMSGTGELLFRPTGAPRSDPTASTGYVVNASGAPVGATGAYFADTRSPVEPGYLLVVAFGVTAGTVLTTTYAHVMEYIPEPGASALVNPRLERLDSDRVGHIKEDLARKASESLGEDGAERIKNTIRDIVDAGRKGYRIGTAIYEGYAAASAAGGAGPGYRSGYHLADW